MKALSMALVLAVAGWAALAMGQTAQPPAPAQQPCSASPQPAPCKAGQSPDGNKDTTDKFPFPGDTTGSGSATVPVPPSAPATSGAATPEAPSGATPDAQSGKQFPFPGDDSDKQFPFPGEPGASGASGGSSSSSSSSDSTMPDASGDANPDGGGRRLLKRVNPVGEKLLTPEDREAEDLKVAKFYTGSGDLQGAYLRSQDAVKTMPNDPDAHCTLAETAEKLKKRDEAISEFNACLKLDPVEKQAKLAHKELDKLR